MSPETRETFDLFGSHSEGFEIFDAELDALDAVIRTLVLDRNVSVVARALKDRKATLDGHIALADGTADETAASAGLVSRGEILLEFVNEPILCVNVECVGCEDRNRVRAVLVNASKVAHINEKTVVFVTDSVEELFNAVAVLRDSAVVFGAGLDAEGSGILGDLAILGFILLIIVSADRIFEAVNDVKNGNLNRTIDTKYMPPFMKRFAEAEDYGINNRVLDTMILARKYLLTLHIQMATITKNLNCF